MGTALENIIAKLKTSLNAETVAVYDFSESHAGHAELKPQSTNLHLQGEIKSEKFRGLSRLAKERMVNSILQTELDDGTIHALSLSLIEL